MQKETAAKAIIVGIVITVVGGIILAILNELLFSKRIQDPPPPEAKSLVIQIDYAQSGRFVILGPNPGGVWASTPPSNDFLWHSIDVSITNNCNQKIHINPANFRLSFSKSAEFDESNEYTPTTEGLEFQTQRLQSKMLNAGETITGKLTFRVKDKADDESNSRYDIVKYAGSFDCEVSYNGQK